MLGIKDHNAYFFKKMHIVKECRELIQFIIGGWRLFYQNNRPVTPSLLI
jgi:hypothetical protein